MDITILTIILAIALVILAISIFSQSGYGTIASGLLMLVIGVICFTSNVQYAIGTNATETILSNISTNTVTRTMFIPVESAIQQLLGYVFLFFGLGSMYLGITYTVKTIKEEKDAD